MKQDGTIGADNGDHHGCPEYYLFCPDKHVLDNVTSEGYYTMKT